MTELNRIVASWWTEITDFLISWELIVPLILRLISNPPRGFERHSYQCEDRQPYCVLKPAIACNFSCTHQTCLDEGKNPPHCLICVIAYTAVLNLMSPNHSNESLWWRPMANHSTLPWRKCSRHDIETGIVFESPWWQRMKAYRNLHRHLCVRRVNKLRRYITLQNGNTWRTRMVRKSNNFWCRHGSGQDRKTLLSLKRGRAAEEDECQEW